MLLSVQDLTVSYRTRGGELRAVEGVSLDVERGQSLGIVGESGCGKSTLVRALLRVLPPNGRITRGRILFDGLDLAALPSAALRRVRWRRIALIPQSAMNALNPVMRIGDQIVETIVAHERTPRAAAHRRAAELLELVGVEPHRLADYPFQFSGGMRQRVAIAMAVALRPDLIIADEPTTALDVLVQDRVLGLLQRLRAELGLTLLYITHDVPVVSELCDRIAVMYAGRVVEHGPLRAVFARPVHPYTMGLLQASARGTASGPIVSIPGTPPDLLEPPAGCRFTARCPFATAMCAAQDPALAVVGPARSAACHYAMDAGRMREEMERHDVWTAGGRVS
ncbi:MAG TPA: ABC transporter ATP-binding protein [bacterium]|nr:ABC transporter ATP-binding protein [bacterium]